MRSCLLSILRLYKVDDDPVHPLIVRPERDRMKIIDMLNMVFQLLLTACLKRIPFLRKQLRQLHLVIVIVFVPGCPAGKNDDLFSSFQAGGHRPCSRMGYDQVASVDHLFKIFIRYHVKAFIIGRMIMVKPYLSRYLGPIQNAFFTQLVNSLK